jgi:chloramphenicol-sensitive protein RarD
MKDGDTRAGFIIAAITYAIWGLLPLYFKAIGHVPALELLAHRIVWSVPVAAIALSIQGLWPSFRAAVSSRKTLGYTLLTAIIISVNWGTYVWAVVSGHALETALGYYINPLFSIFLARVLLGEKLNTMQLFAISLAVLAVVILTWDAGGLPWVSIILPVTWGFYALLKRTMPVEPTQGFFIEVAMLAIPALVFLSWFESTSRGHFLNATTSDMALLMGTGLVTGIPLTLYAIAAKRLRLSTIALMQYSAPSVVFLLAVFVFEEPFSTGKLAAFLLIWTALALYSWSAFGKRRPA